MYFSNVVAALLLMSSASAFNSTSIVDEQKIVVAGDSWGTVLAGGSALGISYLERALRGHSCPSNVQNIAIPGTTATEWSDPDGNYLSTLVKAASGADHVWITLMGNDALEQMPSCARTGKSSSECGDQLYDDMVDKMGQIVDAVHEANKDAKVVGMGYEMMFGGAGCGVIAADLFPQCWIGEEKSDQSSIRCFNTQVLRMQGVWDELASTRDFLTSINLLGLTQAADGDEEALIGQPNLDKLGPHWAWPDYEGCIHPGILPHGDAKLSAAEMLMEEMYNQYWSEAYSC
ncbi:hypothetical protein TrST_g149 [Triparma strigata]|uniref:SGNH hydrolase-type esterase domain-containing protein n=1 Tax=Triparma strigata TaxID=1606541 RepID=A0A9W7C0C6_9STRA|nr:hypothetical protein TrST_g149 [Triparma strigata]